MTMELSTASTSARASKSTTRGQAAFRRLSETISIRSGRGIGDSLYLRPIVGHFVSLGHRVVALSDYPDIFDGSGATVSRFTRIGVMRIAHYTHNMRNQSTTQYQDMLSGAGVDANLPLRFAWTIKNHELVYRLLTEAAGRPLVLVHGGRQPMARDDGFGIDLMPKQRAFGTVLDALDDCYRVRVGNAAHLYDLPVDVDLQGQTSVADLLDLSAVSSAVVAQCSFAVPLAEAFNKPLLAIWAAAGLSSKTPYVRLITPKKVLTNDRSRYIVDDDREDSIRKAARALRGL